MDSSRTNNGWLGVGSREWLTIIKLLVMNTVLARLIAFFLPSFIAVGVAAFFVLLFAFRYREHRNFKKWFLFALCYVIVITGVVFAVDRIWLQPAN